MELKDQVQGVVLGLFGAYAGGYLADLTSQAENGNPVELAAGLVSLQTPLLGVDLADDSVWVDTILGHLGVSSTSAAYTAAAAWANGELDAGASRANVIIAAVAYLLGDDVEAQYADVATAFKADVAAGVEWSEGDGKDVLGIADLRVEAGNPATGSSFNLTAALAAVDAAAADKKAFLDSLDLDANGKLDTAKAPAGDGVTQAAQETAVGTAATTLETKVGTVLTTGYTGKLVSTVADGVLEAVGAVAYDGAGYNAGASDAIQDSILATQKLIIAADLKDAQEDLTKATTQVAKVANLQSAIDAYNAAAATVVSTGKALAATTAALAGAELAFDTANSTGGGSDVANVVFSGALAYTASTGLFTARTVTYDIQDDDGVNDQALFSIATDGTVTLDNTQTAITADEAASLKAAIEAQLAALKADGDAKALADSRLGAIEIIDGSLTDGTTTAAGVYNNDGTALQFDALAYNNAKDNVTAIEKLLTDLAAAEAKVTAARENTTELKSLNDAITAANKVLTDEGYNVVALADLSNVNATAKDDVFTLSALKTVDVAADAATINLFGFAGDDVIVATGYTLGGTTGNDSVLEVFVKQVGANTVLTFEESAFGSNAASVETFTVTLTGVAADDVTVANGYIQLA